MLLYRALVPCRFQISGPHISYIATSNSTNVPVSWHRGLEFTSQTASGYQLNPFLPLNTLLLLFLLANPVAPCSHFLIVHSTDTSAEKHFLSSLCLPKVMLSWSREQQNVGHGLCWPSETYSLLSFLCVRSSSLTYLTPFFYFISKIRVRIPCFFTENIKSQKLWGWPWCCSALLTL